MSQNLVQLNQQTMRSARRRHPELTPVMPRERDSATATAASTPRTTRPEPLKAFENQDFSPKPGPKRAVSMTRLDQLAQPRQRYLEATIKQRTGNSSNNSNDCMVKSMIELPAKTPAANIRTTKGMSTSMTQLNRFPTRKPQPSAVPLCATSGAYRPDQLVSYLHQKLSKSLVQLTVKSHREKREKSSRPRNTTMTEQSASSAALAKAPSKYPTIHTT